MPKVSIIIPCFNLAQYIYDTIDSIDKQTFTNYELIIVNDGSDDASTLNKLRELKEAGYRVLDTTNQGLAAARNNGIKASSGEYILPIDSDDKIGPKYLEEAIKLLDSRPDVKIVFAEAEYFGEMQGPMELYYNRRDLQEFTVEQILLSNFVYCTSLYRRTDYDLVSGYNTNMRYGWEDWDFLLSMLSNGGIIYKLSDVHFYYRIRNQSMLRSIDSEMKAMLSRQLYINHSKLYTRLFTDPLSLYCEKRELERQLTLIKNSRSYILSQKISFFLTYLKNKKIQTSAFLNI